MMKERAKRDSERHLAQLDLSPAHLVPAPRKAVPSYTSHPYNVLANMSVHRPLANCPATRPDRAPTASDTDVDSNLLGTGKFTKAAIIGQAGGIWATSAGYSVRPLSAFLLRTVATARPDDRRRDGS